MIKSNSNATVLTAEVQISTGYIATEECACVNSAFRSLALTRSGIVSNMIWLVFAVSFIWFPYFGMVTIPCRDRKTRHSSPWFPCEVKRDTTDYIKLHVSSKFIVRKNNLVQCRNFILTMHIIALRIFPVWNSIILCFLKV